MKTINLNSRKIISSPVFLDVIDATALVAETFGRHFTTQTFDQCLSCTIDDTREFNLINAF